MRLKFVHPRHYTKCDILVFDIIGAGWIDQCLPVGSSSATVSFRNGFPVFPSLRFARGVLRAFFQYSPMEPAWLSVIFLSGIVEHMSPKLLVSFADNNLALAKFSENNSEIMVVLVQNGLRSKHGITHGQNLPIYFSFGKAEETIFRQANISCKKYLPIGSVKLGLGLSLHNRTLQTSSDIAFISHYRPDMFSKHSPNLARLIERNQRQLFSSCVDYSNNSGRRIVVLTKTRNAKDQDAERLYYLKFAEQEQVDFITPDKSTKELDSYLSGLSSELVVHPASTLGIELFGAGKKVVLGATADSELVNAWGISEYLDLLPEFTKMEPNPEMRGFRALVDHLLAIPVDEYLEITAEARKALMSMPLEVPPHLKIRKTIEALMNDV